MISVIAWIARTRISSVGRILVLILVSAISVPVRGFTAHSFQFTKPLIAPIQWKGTTFRDNHIGLFMSDVPQDDEKQKKKKNSNPRRRTSLRTTTDPWWKLPPSPEDQFVLIGDLLSLSVYGISDHFVCQIMSQQMIPSDSHVIFNDMVVNSGASLHAPVWWEAGSPQASSILQATMESHLVTQYSPLLEPMGQATTLLAGAWLLAGWFHRAFLYQNTLDCTTEKVLYVTARTWITTCLILFGLVVMTQAAMDVENFATNFAKGDVDYIVDSLTVLMVWRFMASTLISGGIK